MGVRFVQAKAGEFPRAGETIKKKYARMLEALHFPVGCVDRAYGELLMTRHTQAEPVGFICKAEKSIPWKMAGNLDEVDFSSRKVACQLSPLLRIASRKKLR
jgi:hypothetical protein